MQQHQYNPVQQQQVQVNMGGGNLDMLARVQGIYIKQRPDYIENLGFCEVKNVYHVFPTDPTGAKPDFERVPPIFKCKEDSSCIQRVCLPGACRAFDMKVKQYGPQSDFTILRMSREYKCTFLCLARPMLEVFSNDGHKLGQIYYPFMCCDKGVEVQDINGNMMFRVIGSCCQWPFLVDLPCEPCQKAVFDVMDPSGMVITEIRKESPGCCAAWCSDATTFSIVFPMSLNPLQRALLLATSLFLDMNYFEKSPADKNNEAV